jgi:hypothetical protein
MDHLGNLGCVALRETKEIKGVNVHCVHQVKRVQKENLEEMDKMDFLEIEVHQGEEGSKVKLGKMDLQECPDHKDQWVSRATLADQEQRETEGKMQCISLYLVLQEPGGREESRGCQELLDQKETWDTQAFLVSLENKGLKEIWGCLVLMVFLERVVLLDTLDQKVLQGMGKREILGRKVMKDPGDKKDIQDQRV